VYEKPSPAAGVGRKGANVYEKPSPVAGVGQKWSNVYEKPSSAAWGSHALLRYRFLFFRTSEKKAPFVLENPDYLANQ
jgi:hypothetical protein